MDLHYLQRSLRESYPSDDVDVILVMPGVWVLHWRTMFLEGRSLNSRMPSSRMLPDGGFDRVVALELVLAWVIDLRAHVHETRSIFSDEQNVIPG